MSATPATVQVVNVGSGQLLTSAFAIGRARDMGLITPTLDSTNAFFQVGLAQGGPFFRINSLALGTGSAAALLSGFNAFPWGRLEMTVSQAAVRSIQVISRAG